MNIVELATYLLGTLLFVGFALWYVKSGHVYVKGGISTTIRFKMWLVEMFDNPMARQVVLYLREWCKQPAITWFMFGVAFEAVGLGIQGMFAMDTYPLLDFLVAGIVATALYVYQNRKVPNVKRV